MRRGRLLAPLVALIASVGAAAVGYTLRPALNPVNVYAGYALTIQIDANFAGPKGDHVLFRSLSASGPRIAVSPNCGWATPDCWKIGGVQGVWNESPSTTFYLRVAPAPDAAPGPYTVTVSTAASGVERSIAVPIKVLAVPPPPSRGGNPKEAPNLRGLGEWRREMTEVGERWCDPKAVYGFGNERDVWYYDGAYVYYQVADYTGKAKWKTCALNIVRQYRDYVMSSNPPGAIPGWRVFTQGLRRAYGETGDPSYKAAVAALIDKSAFAAKNGDPDDRNIRETAYLLRAFTDAHALGVNVDPARALTAANYLIGMAQVLFSGPPQTTQAMIHEDLYDSILAEALIYYYDNWVKDPRIPPTIKTLTSWMYTYLWDQRSHAMMYNPFPKNTGFPRHCEDMCQEKERTLVNLVAPAYFWYWRLTGDDEARRQGDELFAHALDDPIDDKGKSYSQNYHWSFAGVEWRTKP